MTGTQEGAARRLVVVRHAKSDWTTAVADHDRPLNGRGRREAPLLGTWLAEHGVTPDLVLVSSAVRARTTWDLAAGSLPTAPAHRVDERLYAAGPASVLGVVAQVDPVVRTLVTVGHEPTASDLVQVLAGAGSDAAALAELDAGFRTACAAVLDTDAPTWAALADAPEGSCRLVAFAVPR